MYLYIFGYNTGCADLNELFNQPERMNAFSIFFLHFDQYKLIENQLSSLTVLLTKRKSTGKCFYCYLVLLRLHLCRNK